MKVFIKAYLKKNLGDDLFLKIILEKYPNIQFYFNADNSYHELFPKSNNFILFPSDPKTRLNYLQRAIIKISKKLFNFKYISKLYKLFLYPSIKKELNGTEGFLVIGGSMFMQAPGIVYENEEYIEIYRTIIERFHRIKKFVLGANFGPYRDNRYLVDCKSLLAGFDDVCFRDSYSKNLFPNEDKIRWAPDIVFNLDIKKYQECNNENSNVIGMSLVSIKKFKNSHNITHSSYVEGWRKVILSFINKGFHLKFFSFSAHEGDEILINELTEGLQDQNITKVFYRDNIDIVLQEIASVNTFICSRFHSMILALLFGKKMIPVIYSQKMINVLDDIHFAGTSFDIHSFHLLNSENIINATKLDEERIDSIRKDAEKHFLRFDSFLS